MPRQDPDSTPAEVRDTPIAVDMRAIAPLRCKLARLGAGRFAQVEGAPHREALATVGPQ